MALAGCLPKQTLAPPPRVFGWSQVDLRIRQLTPSNVVDIPQYAVKGRHVGDGRTAVYARVPLPAFSFQITNRGALPIHLDRVKAWITSDNGGRWEVVTDRGKIVERTVAHARKLIGKSAIVIDDAKGTPPLDVIAEAARTMPILGAHDAATIVAPHYTWSGAIVIDGDEDQLLALRRLEPMDRLVLHIEGVRTDEETIPYSNLGFHVEPSLGPHEIHCGDGRIVEKAIDCGEPVGYATALDGSCLQENVVSAWVYGRPILAPFIDGQPITTTDATQMLRAEPATASTEARAWRMRAAGWTLIGLGGFSAAASAATLGTRGRGDIAPAALGLLGISVVGIGFVVAAHRTHGAAVGHYNRLAYRTGLCPRATKLRNNDNYKERPLNYTPYHFNDSFRQMR